MAEANFEDAPIPDLTNVDPSGGGAGQCPPGWHLMMISNVETKPKNDKGNIVHVVHFECMEPAHAGKVAKENFTVTHPVGLSRYCGLIEAVGFTQKTGLRTSMLKGRPVMILVVEEDFETKEGKPAKSSKASSWKSGKEEFQKLISGQSVATQAAGSTPATATAGAGKGDLGF